MPLNRRGRDTLKLRDESTMDSEEALAKQQAAAEERRQESHRLVGETIKRVLEDSEHPCGSSRTYLLCINYRGNPSTWH